jgi:type II secretory pathway predicted ATPase ExeA
MYRSHWGLRESPFRGCLDPRFFYQSPAHEEALARLNFLVNEHRRLGLLMGPAGTGKSLLLGVFAEELRRRGTAVAKISLAGVEPAEMLWLVAADLGLNAEPAAPLAVLWRMVGDRLLEYRYQQLATVILLDDADLATRQTLVQVARLATHDPSPHSRLTLVLAGQEGRMAQLGPRLLDLAELRIDIGPWTQDETGGFLRASLAQAGAGRTVFDGPAVARVHELARGVPRRVARLADLALLAGAGRAAEQIDASTVESACQELDAAAV